MAIALFPTIQATANDAYLEFGRIFQTVNDHGRARDLFFVIVPASAVSIATTVDFLCATRDSEIAGLSALLALLANIAVLLSGLIGFLMMPEDTILNSDGFRLFSGVILFGLSVSVITELWVSGAAERQRKLQRRNRAEMAGLAQRSEQHSAGPRS